MTSPRLGGSGAGNDPIGWIARQLESLQTQIVELRAARTLNAATIGSGGLTVQGGKIVIKDTDGNTLLTLDADGLTVANDGTITVDGNLDVTGTETVSGNLTVSGTETVSGNLKVSGKLNVTGDTVIGGTLSLPNGIIDNAALAHPTQPSSQFADDASVTLTVAGTDYATGTMALPSGFTAVNVLVAANVGNSRSASTSAPFYSQVWAQIQEDPDTWWVQSADIATTCAGSSAASIQTIAGYFWTGLPAGSHIDFGVWAAVDSTSGWLSGAGNAHTNLWVTFYR